MKRSNKRGTTTSAFGAPGRANHDASAFYGSRLYDALPKEKRLKYVENAIPAKYLDRIFCRSSETMAELPDCSIHLMVTSPPYNVGKVYDDNLTLAEYLSFLKRVFRQVYRVLVPGGRACINIANLGRRPYIPLHAFIIKDMLSLKFLMRGEIIWDKGSSSSGSTAWGSWMSPSNPTLRDVHEYVLVFSKGEYRRQMDGNRKGTLTRDRFLELTKSVWGFPTERAKRVGHPAPFPVELPLRLIQLYTFEGETVLDPFMGSGQTALAALQAQRHFVGYEIEERYARLARQRIRALKEEIAAAP